MKKEYSIRLEQPSDFREVENLTREAFWDVYRPGCNEHLVLHKLRKADSFVKELSYVCVEGNQIVGHIAYSKVTITAEDGIKKTAIGFGPISVLPELQKIGIGSELIKVTVEKARELGSPAIFITGDHKYYHRFGFESASKYGVHLEGIPKEDEAKFFMVLVLDQKAMEEYKGICDFDPAFAPTNEELEEFEKGFPKKEKREAKASDL